MRDLAIAVASFLVLLVAVSYVLSPSGSAMAMTVDEGHDPGYGAHYHDCPVSQHGPQSRSTEVVYGNIAARNGVRVSHVSLRFDGVSRDISRDQAEVTVGSSGTYRAVVHLPSGQYRVTLQLIEDGHRVTATRTVRLLDQRAYNVSASVGRGGIFTFLPVWSY